MTITNIQEPRERKKKRER